MTRFIFVPCALVFSVFAHASLAFEATETEVSAFVASDRNRDGALSEGEFRTFVQHMAAARHSTATLIVQFGAYGYAFRIVDLNKDGVASPQELRSVDNAQPR